MLMLYLGLLFFIYEFFIEFFRLALEFASVTAAAWSRRGLLCPFDCCQFKYHYIAIKLFLDSLQSILNLMHLMQWRDSDFADVAPAVVPSSPPPSLPAPATSDWASVGRWLAQQQQARRAELLQAKQSGGAAGSSPAPPSSAASVSHSFTLFPRDSTLFGQLPLIDPLELVKCKLCSRIVKSSVFASHLGTFFLDSFRVLLLWPGLILMFSFNQTNVTLRVSPSRCPLPLHHNP
jgi:hypothetical protein